METFTRAVSASGRHVGSLTFSESVHTWMALGMRRAVLSFLIDQLSFSRTVSYGREHTHTILFIKKNNTTAPLKTGDHNRRIQTPEAHQRFPAEDVAIETDPVFREVESSLKEDVSLEGAGVV